MRFWFTIFRVQDISLTKSSSTSTTPSSAKSSSYLTQSSRTTAVSSSTKTGYDMEIAMIFTQPVDRAAGGLTEIALPASELWQDAINPVQNSTGTSCYPSQFHSGVLATNPGTSLALASELVCPCDWLSVRLGNLKCERHICCLKYVILSLRSMTFC